MKTKKLIAAALTLVLLLSEFSGVGCLTALAAGDTVSYSRMNPEVAILNAYTGNDSGFYTKVQNDAHYNFAKKISGLGYEKTISDDCSVSYDSFGGTVLSRLSNQIYNPMEASYSATFKNKNGHSHAMGLIKIDTSYISSVMYINNGIAATPSGLGGISSTTTRQGNGKFKNYYPRSDGKLRIDYQNSKRLYTVLTGKEYKCNCGGDVYNHTIVFRDQTAPFIMQTDILNASGAETSEFTAGEKIVIRLTCSEPLRFAGDAVPGKEICIGLQTDGGGKGDQLIAKLTELKTNEGSVHYNATNVSEMTFEYTVPASMNGKVVTVTGLDFAPTNINTNTQAALYDSQGKIGLVQVCGTEKFSLDGYDKIGYTRTTSYVTDLAGNALEDTGASCRFYIDAQAPYAAQINASAQTNNADVKEALGKSGMSPEDPTYADASDQNLSVGDSITFSVCFNEIITPNINTLSGNRYYANATLTTNLLNAGGQPVTVQSMWAQKTVAPKSELGKGSSNGYVTLIEFAPITITEGMTIAGGGNSISATGISFSGDPADNAGNLCAGGGTLPAVAQKYLLDVTPPEAVLTSDVQKKADGSFVLGVTISDSSSGVASLSGSFRWVQDNGTAPYEYALTVSADAPAETAWKTALMSSTVPFIQTGAAQYLHLRPVSDQEYDVRSSSLIFTLSDYAGNCGTMGVSLGDKVVFDTVPPTVTRGTVSKAYDAVAEKGTLTVTVTIADSGSALNNLADADKPMYLFAAPGLEVSAASDGWQPLTGEINGTNTVFTLTQEVERGVKFEKDLYVMAGDALGNNTGAVRVGTYVYDLADASYTLDYSTSVTARANIKVTELDDDGFLFFYIPTETEGEYYGLHLNSATGDNNIFSDTYLDSTGDGWWGLYTLDEGENTLTFTLINYLTSISASKLPFVFNDYTGIIDVNVVSGKKTSVSEGLNGGGHEEVTVVQPFKTARDRLYVLENDAGILTAGEYSFYGSDLAGVLEVSLENTSGAVLDTCYSGNAYSGWDLTDDYVMESPAGLPFTVSITPKTGFDWVLDDVDMSSSLLLVYNNNDSEAIAALPLSNSLTQIVTLPELDYGRGEIHIQVLLKRMDTDAYDSGGADAIDLFVDNTPASDDFELSHVVHTYEQNNSDLNPGTADIMFGITADEVLTDLPVDRTPYHPENGTGSSAITVPYYHYEDSYNGDWNSRIYLDFSSDGTDTEEVRFGATICRSGMSVVQAWNVTSGSEKVQLDKQFAKNDENLTEGYVSAYLSRGGRLRLTIADDSDSANAFADTGTLGVVKNTVNIIAVQAVYQNGNTSGIKYYAVYPKEETDYPTITPYTDGVDVSAYGRAVGQETRYEAAFAVPGDRTLFNQRENTLEGQPGDREAFTSRDNRIYSYTMPSGENWASIFMKDSYGIAVPLTMISGHMSDQDAPVINVDSPLTFDAADGTFSTTFTVSDETFRYRNPRVIYSAINVYENSFMPTIHLGFDSDYSQILGVTPDTALDIELDMLYLYDTEGKNYESGVDDDARLYSLWTTDGTDGTGITAVYARLTNDEQIKVTVQGAVSPAVAADDDQDVTLKVAVSDTFGNRSDTASTTANDVFGTVPVVTGAVYKEISSTTWDNALFLTFSAPVQPAESWINRNISGYQTTWYDAFPITNDGDWDITYTDLFGNTYTKPIFLENVFGEYGFDLSISTLDPTAGDVTISAATDDGKDSFVSFSYDPASGKQSYGGSVNGDDAPLYAAEAKTRIVSAEGCYGFFRFGEDHLGERLTDPYRADCTFIYLDNIAKAAPAAELNFYFEEYGDSFTPAELLSRFPDGVTTTNFVRVSYTTARYVTANGETEHIFTNGGDTACTFSYTDNFGNDGSVTVRLADYGITLGTPPAPYQDNEMPSVGVDIYAKKGSAYLQTEFFSLIGTNAADVSRAFADAAYVQDYKLVLNVTDYSAYRVLLLSSEPTSLSYDSAATFRNDSVTLNGNMIHISKEFRTDGEDFWVAVVDNAKAGTGAAADNFSAFKITQSELAKWFDNVSPAIEDTKEVTDSLYQHTLYLKLSDKADDGQATTGTLTASGSTLRKNESSSGAEYPYCVTFNTNAAVPVTLTDAAGNFILSELSPLTEIDDSVPVLTVKWSPGLTTVTNGVTEIDESQPTNGPVNTAVTAHVYSDKPIDISPAATRIEYEDYTGAYTALPQDGSYYGISWDMTSQRVTVTFADDYSYGELIRVTVCAPNGQSEEAYLTLPYGAIDMTPPDCDVDVEPLVRSGETVPYALHYTMTPWETVYIAGKCYDPDTPYSFDLYGRSKKDVSFADLAGNSRVYSFNTEIDCEYAECPVPDNAAPVITFIDPAGGDFSGISATGSAVTATLKSSEACTLSYDGRSMNLMANTETPITFASNGTRTLLFSDHAGNETRITVTVSAIDNIAPVISMTNSTVKVTQGCTPAELKALLDADVTAADNSKTAPTLTYDSSSVDLNVPGTYTVVYTAADAAGNIAEAKRFVKVISKDLPKVCIDGEQLESSGVISIAPGSHTLTVSNLREAGEPYKLVIVRGIYYDGQIKYLENQIAVSPDGEFTISTEGFYTFYLQAQSRQSLRCLIDVEG